MTVTFTNAAAAEMRERIGNALENALKEQPDDEHLQRQLSLLHNAQITTIDSFCLYVIRNHFHEIDLEPNFRIGDEGELKLLKEDVLAKVLLKNYEESAPEFLAFVDGYASGRNDAALSGMILQLYEFSRSYPWPKKWLLAAAESYGIEDEASLESAAFMQSLLQNLKRVSEDLVALSGRAYKLTQDDDGPDMYAKALEGDLKKYKEIAASESFADFYQNYRNLSYDRLASSRGFDGNEEKLELVKKLREMGKDAVKKINRQYFFTSPEIMAEQMKKTAPMAAELVRLTLEFDETFTAEKRRKNLVDFHDLEHFALNIFVDEETGKVKKTAEEFRDNFKEIMIDEYQDSNEVQETILRAISREERGEYNLFMVGDVKQSIYRFRLARPELFMEKYDTYSLTDAKMQRIDLHKNFRSRNEVLDFSNDIFYRIMKRNLGNVEYDADAALYPGASYQEETDMFTPEILLVDGDDELLDDAAADDKKLLEARMIAKRIKELMGTQKVTDKATGELRPVQYSDMVILLRSLSGYADRFAAVLNDAGIPAHTVSATGYFSTVEVQTVLSMLRILDNPRQDIPLTAVLRSPIAGLSDEELAKLRLKDKDVRFYECVLEECERLKQEAEENPGQGRDDSEEKLYRFYVTYEKLRQLVPDTPIHELIELLLKETGYGDYAAAMPAGDRRHANLLMLVEKAIAYENTSYKGLFHFVRYIDELQKYDVDFGEADLIGENENVVRIMSIHKSKGLEFPVCILMGLGKTLKVPDRKAVRTDSEFGISIQAEDPEISTIKNTFMFQAMGHKNQMESLGEELRILYVAMTRAKEQLCMTGMVSSLEEMGLDYNSRSEMNHYCDMVLPAVYRRGDLFDLEVLEWQDLVLEEASQQKEVDREKDRLYNFDTSKVYNVSMHEILELRKTVREEKEVLPVKVSVSELKEKSMEELDMEEFHILSAQEEPDEEPVPSFMGGGKEKRENAGAAYGTVWHQVMAFLDFSHVASRREIRESLEQVVQAGHVRREDLAVIQVSRLEQFFQSELGKQMCLAYEDGRLHREQPFVTSRPAKEVLADSGSEEAVLIQGIIDGYYFTEDGIVLMDYKTDRIQPGKEQDLADRYRTQMAVYRQALQDNTGRPVIKTVLYSFSLGKEVELEF